MAEHALKTWPNAFDAVASGAKRFEWRRDDRGFEVGDTLILQRWDPQSMRYGIEAENFVELRCVVTYILRGVFGVPSDFCVMSIEVKNG